MRLYDWETRMTAYLARVAREGFAWGRHDCALFAAGAVEALTGIDPAAEWRGRYDSLAGGLRLMREAGFKDHFAAARSWYPASSPAHALPGDLVVIGADEALGVIQGELAYVLTEAGIGLVPVDAASALLAVR